MTHGIYPHAQERLINVNYSAGRDGYQPRLLIVHHMEGTLTGTDDWFRDPASDVSAHFGVGLDGTVLQWVDCDNTAWHAMAANEISIGVECEGTHTEPLTTAQIEAIAGIMAWAHDTYPEIRTWLNSRPDTGSGLSWHGLGGAAWGGHYDCPGLPTVHQLGQILEEAFAFAEQVEPASGVMGESRAFGEPGPGAADPVPPTAPSPDLATAPDATTSHTEPEHPAVTIAAAMIGLQSRAPAWQISQEGDSYVARLDGSRTVLDAADLIDLEHRMTQLYPGSVLA